MYIVNSAHLTRMQSPQQLQFVLFVFEKAPPHQSQFTQEINYMSIIKDYKAVRVVILLSTHFSFIGNQIFFLGSARLVLRMASRRPNFCHLLKGTLFNAAIRCAIVDLEHILIER